MRASAERRRRYAAVGMRGDGRRRYSAGDGLGQDHSALALEHGRTHGLGHEELPELAYFTFHGRGCALVTRVRVHQALGRVAERAAAGATGAALLHMLHATSERKQLGVPLFARGKRTRLIVVGVIDRLGGFTAAVSVGRSMRVGGKTASACCVHGAGVRGVG